MNIKVFFIEKLDKYRRLKKIISFPVRCIKYIKIISQGKSKGFNLCLLTESFGDNTFFGYYDINPQCNDRFIFHKINGQSVSICLIESKNNDVLGSTLTWNYQQGAMTQWIDEEHIIYNKVVNDKLVACVCKSVGDAHTLYDYPVSLSLSSGYLSINYTRLFNSEYGYKIKKDFININQSIELDKDGLIYVDYSGNSELLVSLKDIKDTYIDFPDDCEHFINHLSVSPDEKNVIFIHRIVSNHGRRSRLYMYNFATKEIRVLLDEKFVSHYSWLNECSFVIYCRVRGVNGYFEYNIMNNECVPFLNGDLDKFGDGHPTVSDNGKYVLTDTYPDSKAMRTLILVNLEDRSYKTIASFYTPFKFFDEKRCDLHPRWVDHQTISFDSVHEGYRSCYKANIGNLL